MATLISGPRRIAAAFSSDEERWQAVAKRDPAADGAFVYSVATTGVYCRPVCPARLALRRNVRFHASWREAEAAGFRACRRCRPSESGLKQRHAAAVARACRYIEASDEAPGLAELSELVGMSRHHFHRVFRAQTGVTPKSYAAAQRAKRVRSGLARSPTVTEAIYAAGFNSNGRFYESSGEMLGMRPTDYRAGGDGTTLRFAIGECWLGSVLVAASNTGICAILLGDERGELKRGLRERFPKARLIDADAAFKRVVAAVVRFVAAPDIGLDLPLDIRGTAFQRRVWEALRKVPAGSTTSYSELAARIGRPKAARAVARAVAANPLAVAVPCHRAVRKGGALSGYRWGVERKGALLGRERAS
jgi:AraC family transcriptional regulator of adaptative response/methylated-DNA-[protein]-cysteine methyltransferase